MEHELPKADSLNGVNISLANIAKSVDRLEIKIDKIQDAFVTVAVFNEHIKVDDDHENRLRTNTAAIAEIRTSVSDIATQLKTYGTIVTVVLAGLEVGLHFLK